MDVGTHARRFACHAIIKGMTSKSSYLKLVILSVGLLLLMPYALYYYMHDSVRLLRSKLVDSRLLSSSKIIYSSGSYWRGGEVQGLVVGRLSTQEQRQALLRAKPFKDCAQPAGCTGWTSGQSFQTYLIGDNSYDLFKQLQNRKANLSASQFLDKTSHCITRYSSYTHGEAPQVSSNRDEFCVTEDGTFAYVFRDF